MALSAESKAAAEQIAQGFDDAAQFLRETVYIDPKARYESKAHSHPRIWCSHHHEMLSKRQIEKEKKGRCYSCRHAGFLRKGE